MITADHGPGKWIIEKVVYVFCYASSFTLVMYFLLVSRTAVSGAHNTIVTARAGKDLISSLVSGLLTIVSITN